MEVYETKINIDVTVPSCIDTLMYVNPALPGNPGYAEAKKEVFVKLREGLKWEE